MLAVVTNRAVTEPDAPRLPRGVRLERTRGYRKPAGAIVVTRSTRWGNPFDHKRYGRTEAVRMFREFLLAGTTSSPDGQRFTGAVPVPGMRWGFPSVRQVRTHLAGADLACYCDLAGPCHRDVLLHVASARGVDEGVGGDEGAVPGRGGGVR